MAEGARVAEQKRRECNLVHKEFLICLTLAGFSFVVVQSSEVSITQEIVFFGECWCSNKLF